MLNFLFISLLDFVLTLYNIMLQYVSGPSDSNAILFLAPPWRSIWINICWGDPHTNWHSYDYEIKERMILFVNIGESIYCPTILDCKIKEDLLKVGESDIPGAGEGLFARRDIQVHFLDLFASFNPTQNKGIFRSTCLVFKKKSKQHH